MLSILLLLLVTLSNGQTQPKLWPIPSQYTVSASLNLNVDMSSFKFSQNAQSEIINGAFARYMALIFPTKPEGSANSTFATLNGLSLTIKDPSENTLGYGMDESYTLTITSQGGVATLDSNTVWGALRGLETFSQLVVFNTAQNYYQVSYRLLLIHQDLVTENHDCQTFPNQTIYYESFAFFSLC